MQRPISWMILEFIKNLPIEFIKRIYQWVYQLKWTITLPNLECAVSAILGGQQAGDQHWDYRCSNPLLTGQVLIICDSLVFRPKWDISIPFSRLRECCGREGGKTGWGGCAVKCIPDMALLVWLYILSSSCGHLCKTCMHTQTQV